MKHFSLIRYLAVSVACVGVATPATAIEAPHRIAPAADVSLDQQGRLIGQVLDRQGGPQQDAIIHVLQEGKPIAQARTTAEGYFAVADLPGGIYQVTAGDAVGTYRVWSPGSAPPSAGPGVLLVAGQQVQAGQFGLPGIHDGVGAWLSNPIVVGGIIATAIAVPIAVSGNDDDNGS